MVKLGDCYNVHGKMMIERVQWKEDVGWKIVHGIVTGQGPIKKVKHGHCWLERGPLVFDFSNNRNIVMPKSQYYRIGKIKKTKKYTGKEYMKRVAETGTYGPQSSYSIAW